MQNFTELVSLRDRTGGNASLTATFFVPDRPRASILLPAAMGVTQKFYADFAQWLAQRDFLVATFDYRGMGLSAPASLRGCDLSISDWREFDCAAMVDTLKSRLPDRPLFLIGHSLSGQIVGLIPNRRSIDAVVLVASGSGYWREVSKSARRNSVLLWFVLVPLLTRLFSYFPGKALHIVGDLPR